MQKLLVLGVLVLCFSAQAATYRGFIFQKRSGEFESFVGTTKDAKQGKVILIKPFDMFSGDLTYRDLADLEDCVKKEETHAVEVDYSSSRETENIPGVGPVAKISVEAEYRCVEVGAKGIKEIESNILANETTRAYLDKNLRK